MNIAGVWCLSSTGCRLKSPLDTIQDTALTSGNWPFLQTVWWGILPSGEIIFRPKMSRCYSLRQICEERKEHTLNGCDLFQKILETVDLLRDHLFSLIVELLIPDLIFLSSDSSDGMHLSLVTLPFPDLVLQHGSDLALRSGSDLSLQFVTDSSSEPTPEPAHRPDYNSELRDASNVTLQSNSDAAFQTNSDLELQSNSGLTLQPSAKSISYLNEVVDELIDEHKIDALPNWFAAVFDWDEETLNKNRAAWHNRLIGDYATHTGSFDNVKHDHLQSYRQWDQKAFHEQTESSDHVESVKNRKHDHLKLYRQKELKTSIDSDQKNLRYSACEPDFSRSKSLFSVRNRHSRARKDDQQNSDTSTQVSSRHHLTKAHRQHKEESIMGSFFRRIFGFTDEAFEEESTEDLDLSENALRIASLSEGLPGTPEEEHSRHAYILTDVFLIGRDIRKADFALDDPGVSRIHARITRSGGHFFIEDMGSKNGTTIDGIKIKKHTVQLLPEMCRIAFGDAVFYFRSD